MTDMQRYGSPYSSKPNDAGAFVLYSDAEAAIAAAEKRGYDSGLIKSLTIADCYQQGQRDMLAKCIAAVEASAQAGRGPALAPNEWVHLGSVIVALRALEEKP